MVVAVTGSVGFIGSRVVETLRDAGCSIVGIDSQSGDNILSTALIRTFQTVDAVIHLAGVLGTAELFEDPMLAVKVNIEGTLRVLQACQASDTRFVGITMPEVWANVYQATKRCARELAKAWHQNYGVPVCHVRAFNVFGPRQKHHGVQKILPTFAIRAWRNEPIQIWGDGTQTVDLVFVDDIAQMLVDVLSFGDDQIFDGGTGHALSVLEVAELVIAITGSTGGVEYLPMRKGESPTTIVAAGEGWGLLENHPTFREADVVKTVEWYRGIAHADAG
jgi:UDP-glucose 4-epimerase